MPQQTQHRSLPVTPLLTVDAVIPLEDGKLILIKRKNPPPGWALPGGFVEVGETVETACVREAKEETSLDVEIVKLIGVYSDPARDERFHTASCVFLCRIVGGFMDAQDDAACISAFTKEEVDELAIAFDHRQIIENSGVFS
ncbi:MAG TPA: NUDIX hydrolase [Candidatus Lokiarchaeia archaeon]|nr:NUDIX hydrolase [Candidatus Lokiarchaeia archaeon]